MNNEPYNQNGTGYNPPQNPYNQTGYNGYTNPYNQTPYPSTNQQQVNRQYVNQQGYDYGEGPAENLRNKMYNDPYRNSNLDNENNGKVLGVLSIIFGIFASLIGLILGIIGLNKSKVNLVNKTPRTLNIIGIVVSIVFMIGSVILWFLIFHTVKNNNSDFVYGNTSAEKVITRYWEAMAETDKEKAEKCFPSDVDVNLVGEIWENGDIYDWDIDNLEIVKGEKLSASEYEDEYGLSPITSVYSYIATCYYEYDSVPSLEGYMSAEFIVCKYAERYYLLQVNDVDDEYYKEDTEEEGETGYFPFGNDDIGKIDENAPALHFSEDEEQTEILKSAYTDGIAYLSTEDSEGNKSAVYLIKYEDSSKSLEDVAKELGKDFAGNDTLYLGKDLMGFDEAYYCCATESSDSVVGNIDVYTVEDNDGVFHSLILIYPVYDEVTAGLWKSYRVGSGLKDIEDTSEEDTEDVTEEDDTEDEMNNTSGDLFSRQFTFDGTLYTIPFDYSEISDEYTFDLADYGKDDTYLLNPGDSTASTIYLENPNIDEDFDFSIGFWNYSDEVLDIKETSVHSFDMDIRGCDTTNYPSVVLPNGITWGSTLDEVKAAYGEPTEEPYYAESLNYWEYEYESSDGDYTVRLTIYDEYGLTGISVRYYGR